MCSQNSNIRRQTEENPIVPVSWEQLQHSPHNPDLTPFDFYLSGVLKEFLQRTKFSSGDKVKSTMNKWLKTLSKGFYAEQIQKFVFSMGKCILKNEIVLKNKATFFVGDCKLFYCKIHLIIDLCIFIFIGNVCVCVCVYIYIYIFHRLFIPRFHLMIVFFIQLWS